MTLLNSILSVGGLAFTIPLAIHLLFRNRFRTVDWGAMHLLEGVVRINHRRIQVLQMLLLLLRCLVPVLLAFCLARPVLTGFRALPGDAPESLILAIDDSRSMSARHSTGSSRFDSLRLEIESILSDLSRSDEVIMIRSSQIGAAPIVTGRADAIEKIRSIVPNAGRVDLARLVQRALEAATEASQFRRRIVVASDFQTADIGDQTIESLRRVGQPIMAGDQQTQVSLLNAGGDSDLMENLFVASIDIDSPAVVSGRMARLSAQIRNDSDSPKHGLRITWTVDGQPIDSSEIAIDSRSTNTMRINHNFAEPGVREVALSIEVIDAISADNRRAIGVDVIDEVTVLLVDGQPSDQRLKGETDFLAVALSPFAFGEIDRNDAIHSKVVRPAQIGQAMAEVKPNVMVLANVARLEDDSKRLVADFVTTGGSLVLFDGDLVQPDSYNASWKGSLGEWRLPAALGTIVGEPNSKSAKPINIATESQNYSAWVELADDEGSLLESVALFRHRNLSIKSANDLTQATPTMTLLSTNTGFPLVVAADRGRGRIVQFAFPCDDAWSDFPLRAAVVPMMQQLVLDLAGSRKQTTFDLGRPISVSTDELVLSHDPHANASYFVEAPDGTLEPVTPDSSTTPAMLRIHPMQAGVYRFETKATNDDADQLGSTIRIVDVPSVESELQATDPTRLKAVADALGATIYARAADLQSADHTQRYGREIWRWLLALLLLAMIGEIVLQQALSQGSLRVGPT